MLLLLALSCFNSPPPGPNCGDSPWEWQTDFDELMAQLDKGTATPQALADLRSFVEALTSNGAPGPWAHYVVGPYRSKDGIHFEQKGQADLVRASVPEAVVGPEGRLWMFFVDGDVQGLISDAEAGVPQRAGVKGLGGLGAAWSEDGEHFTRQALEFSGPRPALLVDPEIQTLPDGSYRLYAYGVPAERLCPNTPNPGVVPSPHEVVTATSTDLVHWSFEGVAYSSRGGTDPATWCDGQGTCWIFMEGGGRSTDGGRTFTDYKLDFGERAPALADVIRTDEGYLLYESAGQSTWLKTSKDGEDFGRIADIATLGFSPTVVRWKDEIWLYTTFALSPEETLEPEDVPAEGPEDADPVPAATVPTAAPEVPGDMAPPGGTP